jgi:hypothetical protein
MPIDSTWNGRASFSRKSGHDLRLPLISMRREVQIAHRSSCLDESERKKNEEKIEIGGFGRLLWGECCKAERGVEARELSRRVV